MFLKNFFVSRKVKKLKKYLLILGLIFLAVLVIIFYLWRHYQKTPQNLTVEQKETQALIKEVSKIIELPSGETPMVATVLDRDKVQEQVFFKKAETGDKLLAFLKARIAILYRPATNKIIQVSPILIDNNASSTKPDSSVEASPVILK